MTVHISERTARELGFTKPRKRKKAHQPAAQHELVKAFVARSGCWHGYEFKYGSVFCKRGVCK